MEQNKLQELQILEQALQNVLMQKQAFQMELSETQSALGEIEDSSDEVYKVVGQLMIKSDKKKISSELSEKSRLLELRLKAVEKQEESMMQKLEKIRDSVVDSKNN